MNSTFKAGPVHHIRLTVTDVEKSRDFYTRVLGFEVAVDGPPAPEDPFYQLAVDNLQGGIVLTNGAMLLALRPAGPDKDSHRFDPFHVGLDHLSFQIDDLTQLHEAASVLDGLGVGHGPVTELLPYGIAVVSLRDPDGIQLELTAPLG